MNRLTSMEKYRRAVARAKRKADLAHDAAWKAMQAAREIEPFLKATESSVGGTVKEFMAAEHERIVQRSRNAYTATGDATYRLSDLVRLVGAENEVKP